MNKVICFVLGSWLLVGKVSPCAAQTADSLNPYWEISKLNVVIADTGKLSFDVNYTMEQSDSSGISRDTLVGNYKLWGQKFYAQLDSNEYIQDGHNNVAVDHAGKVMIVSGPKEVFPTILQMNIMEPQFLENYVDKINVVDTNRFRKICIEFKDNAPYKSYLLYYDTATYFVSCVKLKIRGQIRLVDQFGSYAPEPNYYTLIKVDFTNYQENAFSGTVFDTSKFFTQVNGVYTVKPAYADYELFDQGLEP